MHKRARRDGCSCRNDAVGSALERRGLGASFEGYYTFVEALDVALSEVKEHAQPYIKIASTNKFLFFSHIIFLYF